MGTALLRGRTRRLIAIISGSVPLLWFLRALTSIGKLVVPCVASQYFGNCVLFCFQCFIKINQRKSYGKNTLFYVFDIQWFLSEFMTNFGFSFLRAGIFYFHNPNIFYMFVSGNISPTSIKRQYEQFIFQPIYSSRG